MRALAAAIVVTVVTDHALAQSDLGLLLGRKDFVCSPLS
jgi:hypothetical protein